MSMALNTTVPTRPMAAAPAIPSVLRAAVHSAGRKATARPAANTMSASTPSRRPAVIGTSRDVARNATTATAVATPSLAPPTVTVRKSERSDTTGAAVTDMLRCSSPIGSGVDGPSPKSKRGRSPGKHQHDCEIGHGPRGERPVHPSLGVRGNQHLPTPAPGPEHREPPGERHADQPCLDPQDGRPPAQQPERQRGASDRDAEARPQAEEH